MTSETKPETPLESLSDHALLVRIVRVAEHLDPMIHDLHRWGTQAAPLLERFGGFKAAIGKGARRGR